MRHVSKKVRVAIATAGVGALLGAAGFAVASFITTGSASGVPGEAESFTALAVSGSQASTGKLLPGETQDITLSFKNKNDVNGRVLAIEPAGKTVSIGDTAVTEGHCFEMVQQHPTYDLGSVELVVEGNGGNGSYLLTDAVTLLGSEDDTNEDGVSDDQACQGMTFTTTWKVKFQATRAPAIAL